MNPKTAQQVNDPQTGQVSTSRHSALSELMIQNAELREQLRVLQSAYDSLSQMKEKAVASRIEMDELRADNEELKAENARILDSVRSWHEFESRVKAESDKANQDLKNLLADNARLTAENELLRGPSHVFLRTMSARLLAPTIEVVSLAEQWMARPKHGMPDRQAIVLKLKNELARLRGLVERKS